MNLNQMEDLCFELQALISCAGKKGKKNKESCIDALYLMKCQQWKQWIKLCKTYGNSVLQVIKKEG